MQKETFEDAIKRITEKDGRFEVEAYFFLKEALDYTAQEASLKSIEHSRHVSAKQLLYGFRDLALKEFGPMASTLFDEWGVKNCADVGDIVFLLINEGVFGKQDNDSPEDFVEVFSFQSAFVDPYLPKQVSTVN